MTHTASAIPLCGLCETPIEGSPLCPACMKSDNPEVEEIEYDNINCI